MQFYNILITKIKPFFGDRPVSFQTLKGHLVQLVLSETFLESKQLLLATIVLTGQSHLFGPLRSLVVLDCLFSGSKCHPKARFDGYFLPFLRYFKLLVWSDPEFTEVTVRGC